MLFYQVINIIGMYCVSESRNIIRIYALSVVVGQCYSSSPSLSKWICDIDYVSAAKQCKH